MADNVDHGMQAEYVADKMVTILDKDDLAPHYVIGEPLQKVSTLARRLLPGRIWEKVLARYYQ